MTDWTEKQREYTETFGRQMEAARVSTLDFWKHLTIIEATVLGLTVGLTQGTSGRPTAWLAWSWVLLLLGIATGSLLIKVFIDAQLDSSIRIFQAGYDLAGIQGRVDRGALTTGSDEHTGLFVAAVQLMPGPGAIAFTQTALALADKYRTSLPSSFMGSPTRTPVERHLHMHWQVVAIGFYIVSAAAFLLLVVGVLVAPASRATLS